MPFLSLFRKDKDTPSPSSSFSRARSRPSVASSRATGSPPPQLADISPQSDLSYILPELEDFQVNRPTSPDKAETVTKRGLLRRKAGSALVTPTTRHTPTPATLRPASAALIIDPPRTPTNHNTNLHSDSDDHPLIPPPPRASVFAGYSYSEPDRPRSQSVPAESERPRPPRPQSHPHDMKKVKKEKESSSSRGGLFGWRSKKEPVSINTSVEPSESSFSLKSFRHVGPPSPVVKPSESTSSLVPVSNGSPTTGASSISTACPVPGRSTPVARERVNSTSSEGMMAAGLFRQAARRSSTNLVDEAAEPIRSRMRDLEKRPPPTRSWTEESVVSSGSDRPGPRKSAPDTTSSRRPPLETKPRKSMAENPIDDDEPESPSPFAGRLGESGRTSPFTTRSDSGHVPRLDYSVYGARSDGGIRSGSKLVSRLGTDSSGSGSGSRSGMTSPSSPTKPIMASQIFASPAQIPSGLPRLPGPQGYTGPRAKSPNKPRPSSPEKSRASPPSPNKPRLSAPAATRPTRSPIRTTIPTKTNDGPSIKPGGGMHRRQGSGSSQSSARASQSALGHGRRPSIGQGSMRSASVDVLAHSRQPSGDVFSSSGHGRHHSRQLSTDTLAQNTRGSSVEVLSHTRRPSAFEVVSRPKSPGPAVAVEPARPTQTKTTDQLRQEAIEAMRNGAAGIERAKSPAPSVASRMTKLTTASRSVFDAETTPRKNYVPPPRMSSLAAGLVDSDSDESPEDDEVESESEGLGFGKGKSTAGKGALRGRHGSPGTTTTNAQSGTRPGMVNGSAAPPSRSNSDDSPAGLTRERTITQRDAPPSKTGVSLFDGPVPRARASHSTSAVSAAATARNSAALADANAQLSNVTVSRPGKKHTRGSSFGAGSVSHTRMAAAGTDTDEDEEDESDESSEDDAPLNTLAPAKRPGSAASTAISVRPGPRPSAPIPQSRATAPLITIPGVTAPPPRPPRMNRVPGVGVTRNSSLRGSRSVEDLGRKPVSVRPGPRPFAASPPSSTGDSSSGKAPLTPRDGSEAGRDRSDEARRRERRRSEAKKSVELGNVINGPGPIPDDEDEDMSMHHSQLGHSMGMMGMGWNHSGFFPPGGAAGFPTSQSMPFLHPQLTGPQPMPMGFMPPPPPPGASEAYLQAHHQAMMIAKQTYLSAVAQQAMAAATEQWERSSNMGSGSVYGGSQMSVNMNMNMNMGMMPPMMGMYAGSSYAASAYEGSVAGWGSASAYGGPSGARSVYGGARSEFGGGMKQKLGSGPGHNPNRPRGKTQTAGSDARREPVPPSTWATRRKPGL